MTVDEAMAAAGTSVWAAASVLATEVGRLRTENAELTRRNNAQYRRLDRIEQFYLSLQACDCGSCLTCRFTDVLS